MDWLRRNWPDLIIGVALIAVIAGIVATLLSGGSFLSFGGQRLGGEQPPAVQGSPNADSDTGQAGQDPESSAPADGTSNAQQGGVEPVAPDLQEGGAGASRAQGGAEEDAPADSPQTSGVDAVAPSEAGATPAADEETDQAAQGTAGQEASQGETDQGAAAPEGTSYRISVGAFASREGAQSVTERYSAEGLPTFVASQGDLSLALVGPYASEAEANEVAQRIIEDGGEALVYAFESEGAAGESDSEPGTAQGSASTESSGDGGAVADAVLDTADSVNDAPQSGTFLQAGAFGSSESAQFRREQIEELGYVTSERETGAGLVRLFVGPLGPGEIEEAQTQLGALGIDSFPVSIP